MSTFIAVCGPTGIGKTHQMQRLIQADPEGFTAVLSVTTRVRRGPEDDGWYRFVSPQAVTEFDPADVVSDVLFRDEHYVLLRSEIERALERAPVAFMAIVPPVILRLRTQGVLHGLINCRVGDWSGYVERLTRRGYHAEALRREEEQARAFAYPSADPAWSQIELELGSDIDDDRRFDAAVNQMIRLSKRLL